MLNLERKVAFNIRKSRVSFTFNKLLMVIAYALVLQMVIIILIGAVLGSEASFMQSPTGRLLVNFITAITVIVAVGVVHRFKYIKQELFPNRINIKSVLNGVKWGLISVVAGWSVNWLSFTIYSHLMLDPKPQQATLMLNNLPKTLIIPAIFSIAIIAPIFEEIVFRGLLQRTIGHYATPVIGIVLGSIMFALSHFDFYQIPGLLVLGLCFAFSYHKSKTLLTPIIAHIINNSVFIGFYLFLAN